MTKTKKVIREVMKGVVAMIEEHLAQYREDLEQFETLARRHAKLVGARAKAKSRLQREALDIMVTMSERNIRMRLLTVALNLRAGRRRRRNRYPMAIDRGQDLSDAKWRSRKGWKALDVSPSREDAADRRPGAQKKASDLKVHLGASQRGVGSPKFPNNVTYKLH